MKIISVKPLNEVCTKYLSSLGEFNVIERSLISEKDVKDAQIIIGNIQPHLLDCCEQLKYLQLESAGNENYLPYYRSDFIMCNASGTFGESIAEHLLMGTLMLFRNMDTYMKQQMIHEYKPKHQVRLIQGSTFLIYGTGDIGQSFAKKVKQLGGHTIGIKREVCDVDYFDEVYTASKVKGILANVDVIAFCLPKSNKTTHIFTKQHMDAVKQDTIILNVGRSNAVDQNLIVEYLNNNKIGGAMLDVFDEEPIDKDSMLWDAKRLLITPHVSGTFANDFMYEQFYRIVEHNIKAYMNGKELMNVVSHSEGY